MWGKKTNTEKKKGATRHAELIGQLMLKFYFGSNLTNE